MINTKGVDEVCLWMAISEMMMHGNKLKSPTYYSLTTKYGIVYQHIVNVYSQCPHLRGSAHAKKRNLEDISTA